MAFDNYKVPVVYAIKSLTSADSTQLRMFTQKITQSIDFSVTVNDVLSKLVVAFDFVQFIGEATNLFRIWFDGTYPQNITEYTGAPANFPKYSKIGERGV